MNLNPFRQETPAQFEANLLEEAQREYVRHVAAAEYSAAMAQFYKERIKRLAPEETQ